MRKLLLIILVAALTMLVGCGNDTDDGFVKTGDNVHAEFTLL